MAEVFEEVSWGVFLRDSDILEIRAGDGGGFSKEAR